MQQVSLAPIPTATQPYDDGFVDDAEAATEKSAPKVEHDCMENYDVEEVWISLLC